MLDLKIHSWRASETLSGVYKFKICNTYTLYVYLYPVTLSVIYMVGQKVWVMVA